MSWNQVCGLTATEIDDIAQSDGNPCVKKKTYCKNQSKFKSHRPCYISFMILIEMVFP